MFEFLSVLTVSVCRGWGKVCLIYSGTNVHFDRCQKSVSRCISRLVASRSRPSSSLSLSVEVLKYVPVISLAARFCSVSSLRSS